MPWDDGLTYEQRDAAAYSEGHARLLAGPGTGKTWVMTRHVAYLVNELHMLPNAIMALTFTRHAAGELKQRVIGLVDVSPSPYVATLHSFALRQLLRNAEITSADLPQPLRIADDYEERWIIKEDLKSLLNRDVDDVTEALNKLSADWETLRADTADWEREYPDPAFLGAWRDHRRIYGYTLRAELVYQLKRALELHPEFDLEGPPHHLLVDEYQDLNRCDLAVIQALAIRGSKLFVAGDDDQSIYGFRFAHPEGIRRFEEEYDEAVTKPLIVCKRCDQSILDLATWVIKQDYQREPKQLVPDEECGQGLVKILRFTNQEEEAAGIVSICRTLMDAEEYQPNDILILLRQDRNGAYSSVLSSAFQEAGIPVSITEDQDPFGVSRGEVRPGRTVLALMRLGVREDDSLAWRTLLQLRPNNVGARAIQAVYERARDDGTTFAIALAAIASDPDSCARFGRRLSDEYAEIRELTAGLATEVEKHWSPLDATEIIDGLQSLIDSTVPDENERSLIVDRMREAAELSEPDDLAGLLHALSLASGDMEQNIETGKVNVLTMHKAKGLTAKAVVVLAAEDELIPGRAENANDVDDARRLLYVSLTRAKHYLFVTYCQRRTGGQLFTGRDSGHEPRHLTTFLRDAPIRPDPGRQFASQFAEQMEDN